ncbi:MAG: cupin domain-containing protein [Mycobacterium kyogaense]|uniref:cupin domain-containing protein n=1 Tax=Mycobacterium kyogaense TaxID=2212479 RepID=UPI002FF5167A
MTNAILTSLLPGADSADLEDWGPLDEATGEPMAVHGLEVWADGTQSAGIWQCSPGPSFWRQDENEVIYVLSGRMTVTPDGGQPQDLSAGDIAVFPVGWAGTWVIHETLRKVYVLF